MAKIKLIQSKQIEDSLRKTTRQYLAGRLSRPQELEYIQDDQLEIGITSYDEYHPELPHYHTQAYEYQYLLAGMTEYLDIETMETYQFKKGDFYITEPGTKYAQRSQPGTSILFIKVPPGNDKVSLEASKEVICWLEKGKGE